MGTRKTAFRITHVHEFADGDLAIDLDDGEHAALVTLVDRKGRDVELTVQSCTSAAARVWLEDPANWDGIAEQVAVCRARQTAALARQCRAVS
jgi:hypothetical protein